MWNLPSASPHGEAATAARRLKTCVAQVGFVLAFAAAAATCASAQSAEPDRKPNIVLILADDLGYGDVGCFGQKRIKTPNLDKLAADGMRLTQCYAGSTVCAPSRCVLMTGRHTGHATVRGNALVPLRPEDVTVAEVLKQAGYATGLVGKWGLGEPGSSGVPSKQGFDEFFGYLNQKHAHNYYPDYLWRNEEKVPLPNLVTDGVATKRVVYSADSFREEALSFVERKKDAPFFLFLALTSPHANNEAGDHGMEVPSDEPYSAEPWPAPQKNHAAMITRMDRDLGRLFAKIDELGLAEDTLVLFSSDNGPHKEGGGDPEFFQSSGPYKGYKRSLTDGGIRVPTIVRWKGKILPGSSSDAVCGFWDVLPTFAELAGAKPPEGLDGKSLLPILLGEKAAGRIWQPADFLYWEFHENGSRQAVRHGDWKYIRAVGGAAELFDLAADPGETKNVLAEHPDVAARCEAFLATARTESVDWPLQKARPKPPAGPKRNAAKPAAGS